MKLMNWFKYVKRTACRQSCSQLWLRWRHQQLQPASRHRVKCRCSCHRRHRCRTWAQPFGGLWWLCTQLKHSKEEFVQLSASPTDIFNFVFHEFPQPLCSPPVHAWHSRAVLVWSFARLSKSARGHDEPCLFCITRSDEKKNGTCKNHGLTPSAQSEGPARWRKFASMARHAEAFRHRDQKRCRRDFRTALARAFFLRKAKVRQPKGTKTEAADWNPKIKKNPRCLGAMRPHSQ